MNATGTQRQRAVIAAFRMKPEASQGEIANAAGVTQAYVSAVVQDYLASKERDNSCQVTVGARPKPAEVDVAAFALDRRIGGNSGPAECTEKQRRLRIAMAAHPRGEGERKNPYSRRIAAIAEVSPGLVLQAMETMKNEAIGVAARARDAEEAKTRCEVMPAGIGPVTNFRGWIDVFCKFKILSESYLNLAQSQREAYAVAFLKNMRDMADHAQDRAAQSTSG
jgi:DNA-directed RNA polymerase specialized sigma subunit